MIRNRGIKELDDFFENFSEEIRKRINKQGKVKILDAGCGYGLAMIELVKKFKDKIEIIGYNKSKEDGTINGLKEKAVKKGIFTEEEIKKIKNFPKIIYLDADEKLPFKNNSFDFIYCMHSVYLYKDKIKFFEECNRILKKDGIAKISLFEKNMKESKAEVLGSLKNQNSKYFLEIWDEIKEINFIEYFNEIKGIKIKCGRRTDNNHAVIYLEIKKQPKLNFKLALFDYINMGVIAPDRFGMRSIYTTNLNIKQTKK